MYKQDAPRRHRPDYLILVIALVLSAIGLILLYSISPALAAQHDVSNNHFIIRQLIAVGLGILAFGLFSAISLKYIKKLSTGLVVLALLAALAIQFVGEGAGNAARWIQVGGVSFQVVELMKLALIIWLASFLASKMQQGQIGTSSTMKPLLAVIALIVVLVASPFFQSDLGSAAVMMAILAVMAVYAGLPIKPILLVGAVVLASLLLSIATSDYRRERVTTFLNPTADCEGAGYQTCQALIAVGSGGVLGQGIGSGVQAYGYLPEAANDSIFAILAEKFGFLGVSIVLGLYVLLFSRLVRVIERTVNPFAKLFVAGVLTWISTQAIINIGAMVGLLPLKGITLPFISFGGTSILFIMMALGVVFQISRYTSLQALKKQESGDGSESSSYRRRVRRSYYAGSGRS